MNDTLNITTDAVEVNKAFVDLTLKEMKKALSQALRKAANELSKQTKTNLKKAVKGATRHNPKYNDTLAQGVRTSRVFVDDNGKITSMVRIDSSRKSGSGSFRLKILEKGSFKTPNRYAYIKGKQNHKRAYRGTLKAYNFFDDAQRQYMSNYENTLNNYINQAVDKINNKKFGK